jgi:multicomponent Na+:H+ antiporter subunit C
VTAWQLYASAGAAVFAIALHGLFARAHPARRIIAANLLGSGAFLILVAFARRGPATDPVLHALVLTGIVVSVSATALALALVRRLGATRRADEDEHEDEPR